MDSRNVRSTRPWPARHPRLSLLALLTLALIVLVLLWDWNWFKRPVERWVTSTTGRAFHIDGDLDVDLGRTLTVTADGLRFANAAWAREPEMASAKQLQLDLRFWPLLRGQLLIPRIRLDAPVLHLQRSLKGADNWTFGDDHASELPEFRNVRIAQGRMTYFEPGRKTDIALKIDSKQRRPTDAESPISVEGGGRWNANAFTLSGTAESPLELLDSHRPYRINVHAAAGPTKAQARGTLLDPLRFRDLDLTLALSGRNLADLYPLIGVATPDTPPFKLEGQLTRDILKGNRSTWHYDDFSGKVGESDLAGNAAVTIGGKRPFLKADLSSRRLDMDDLAGFIGGAPRAAGDVDPVIEARAAKLAASGKLVPDTPYELDKLRAMDADVHLKARRINQTRLPLDDMDAHLFLDAGVLRLEPLDFGVANGDIRSTIRMDAREKTIRTQAKVKARGLDLQQLMPTPAAAKEAIGKIDGGVDLAGNGNSVARMLATADGSISVGMGRGQVSNLVMELAGLDVQEVLKFLITRDRQVAIRCAWGDFAVKDGLMTSRGLAFDTADTIIIGEGTVNLRDETLDLVLRPRPKDRSLLVFRAPLKLRGTFRDPTFKPDLARVGLRAALALVLGSIAPPAALLATFEHGPGEDSGCGGRYAK